MSNYFERGDKLSKSKFLKSSWPCLIHSAFPFGSTPAANASLPAVTMAWQYIGQLIFNMLILTGLVKGADRIVKEMLGL